MAYLVEVHPQTKERLEAEARKEGQDPASFIAGFLDLHFGVAKNVAPTWDEDWGPSGIETNIDKMTFRPFDLEADLKKRGLPVGRTLEEIADAAEKVLAGADPNVIAEMRRRGLL